VIDHSRMKLGRHPAKPDSRTLKLGNYLKPSLPPASQDKDWTKGIASWGMMLNDVHSNCTIAAAAHAVQVWSANTGREATVTDPIVLSYYEKWDGYNPSNPATDAGGVEIKVFKDWRKNSFHGHKLIAFANTDYGKMEEIRHAISLFGGVYVGLNLPMTAKTQAIWDVVPDGGDDAKPGSWGGHAVFVPKYDAHSLTCITWGALKPMTLAFWKTYVDEAHVLLSHDWLETKGSPVGFDLEQLKKDLEMVH